MGGGRRHRHDGAVGTARVRRARLAAYVGATARRHRGQPRLRPRARRARARPGDRRPRGRARPAGGGLRPADRRQRARGSRVGDARPDRRGATPGVVVRQRGRGLGRWARRPPGKPRRAVRPAGTHRWSGGRLEPAPRRAAPHRRPGRGAVDPRGRRARLVGRRRQRPGWRRGRVERHLARSGGCGGRADGGPGRRRARAAHEPALRRPGARPERPVDPGRHRPGRDRRAGRGDARPGRGHGPVRSQGGGRRGAPRRGRRHRVRCRRPGRAAGPSAGGAHRCGRGRGRHYPPRRLALLCPRGGRPRGVQAPGPLGQAGHRCRAGPPGGAARSSGLRERLVPVGPGPGRRGQPHAHRARPHRQQVDATPGRRPRSARAPLPGAPARGGSTARPGVPQPGRGLGADDRDGLVARGRRI